MSPHPLIYFIEQRESLPQSAFYEAYDHPFLVNLGNRGQETLPGSVHFRTSVVRTTHISGAKKPLPDPRTVVPLAVEKTDANLLQDMISVGRASNNDVIIREPSVSKFHAFFRQEGEFFTVTDARSKNGTRINGRPLQAMRAMPLREGDGIEFADVSLVFFDANGFYELLGQYIKSMR